MGEGRCEEGVAGGRIEWSGGWPRVGAKRAGQDGRRGGRPGGAEESGEERYVGSLTSDNEHSIVSLPCVKKIKNGSVGPKLKTKIKQWGVATPEDDLPKIF